MKLGKLCLAAFLGAMPAVAVAQPAVNVGVDVNVGADADTYDTVAPGDPVESVDVFYDQLEPYGAWVDEPDVGRVFVPDTTDYVPYNNGHWQSTNLGFVWVSSEPHAWATAHYGRWAYSNNYNRWYWHPDTQWGPAWVDWRQTGTDFGWAPLAPEVVIRRGWQPPAESWHYCGSAHVLDVNVNRYYEPRARVVEIHREARPIEHYTMVSNVRVVVGPPAATLRERHVVVRPVKVEARAIGRWTPAEAHAQVERAHEHQATFEVQNQHRIEGNAKLQAAHIKVIESHPDIKVKVNERVQIGTRAATPARVEPARPGQPNRAEPAHVEPGRPGQPNRAEPAHLEPARPAPRPEPAHVEPARPAPRPVEHVAPKPPERAPEQQAPAPTRERVEPARPQEREPARPAPRAPEQHAQPAPRPAPEQHAQPAPRPAPERKEPEHKEPEHKEPERH